MNDRHALYIDESGVAALTDKRYKKFLLTGLAVGHEADTKFSAFFEYIKEIHGIRDGNHFHTFNLFEGKNSKFYIKSDKDARNLAKSLADYINLAPFQAKVYCLSKASVRNYFKLKKCHERLFRKSEVGKATRDIGYEVLATGLIFWFSKNILTTDNSLGAVVAESRLESDHAFLAAFLQSKSPDRYQKGNLDRTIALATKTREQVTSIKFENKIGNCAGLELADLVSYTCFQTAMGKVNKLKNRGMPLLWKAVKAKLDNKKIDTPTFKELSELLPRGRVHEIAQFVKTTSL